MAIMLSSLAISLVIHVIIKVSCTVTASTEFRLTFEVVNYLSHNKMLLFLQIKVLNHGDPMCLLL